jgi:hypothetical protein
MDSPVAAREALRRIRGHHADPKEPTWLLPSEPGLTYVAVVDREREAAESWAADAVVGERRVGNVRFERKGRHVLLFECRGLWMPPEETDSFLAPFIARMEEWQPRPPAP